MKAKSPSQPQPGNLPDNPHLEEEGEPETQKDGAGGLDLFYDEAGRVVLNGDARCSH